MPTRSLVLYMSIEASVCQPDLRAGANDERSGQQAETGGTQE